MSLTSGTRIGPFEVVGSVGAGGMGEVYRARDTKLQREVALKILPDAFALDPDRLARFEREAQVLASLNHPNIGGIYGFEEGPAEAGHHVRALVLELVDGPTLADRIAQGAIPIEEALSVARQIAEALDAAHEHGIIHRDLKPANIKLRPDGTVKVLDFGLAKALEIEPAAAGTPSISPTITSPAATRAGVILGTAAYMSPEQARGKLVDKRADIWAFGCVLYEMLTGRRAFEGEDVTETLASVIKGGLELDRLPAGTRPMLRHVLTRCLERDPKKRFRDIGDVRVELERATEEPGAAAAAQVPVRRADRRWVVAWSAGVAAAIMAAAAIGWWAAEAGRPSRSDASRSRSPLPWSSRRLRVVWWRFLRTARHSCTARAKKALPPVLAPAGSARPNGDSRHRRSGRGTVLFARWAVVGVHGGDNAHEGRVGRRPTRSHRGTACGNAWHELGRGRHDRPRGASRRVVSLFGWRRRTCLECDA